MSEDTPNSSSDRPASSKLVTGLVRLRDATLGKHPLILWLLNAGVLLLLAIWIISDARFSATWSHLQYELGMTGDMSQLDEFANSFSSRSKIFALGTLVVISTISLALVAFGLTMGAKGHRALGSWMIAISLGCGWLGLLTSWDELIWTGKQMRIDSHVAAFEPIARDLRQHWPKADGQNKQLGPFMAYPGDGPKTLILLTKPKIADSGPSFSSVERSDAGGVRFQLSGDERGVWLEWHPAKEEPASFTGGLLEPHNLVRSVALGDGWYLVRYQQAAISS
ncbi:hypothetical protein GC197_01460 [bacterium]|nr:hypothetical protein [bacterium]